MRPEKSKLLKISLCVLSCVFFGCGKNKSNGDGTGTLLTTAEIQTKLKENTNGKNAQQENSPFMKILSSAMTKVLGNQSNDNVQKLRKYINEDGSIKEKFAKELEDPESDASKDFISALEQVIDSINEEVENSLKNCSLNDSFGVTDKAIEEWTKKGLKNREVAKVICAWQRIFSEYSKFLENPLQFLMRGKGWMHRSTVKAIDYSWRKFVGFLQKGYENCENSLKTFTDKMDTGAYKDKEAATEAQNVMDAISDQLGKVKEFVNDSHSIRTTTLTSVYTLIGDHFLPNHGDKLFSLINLQQVNGDNPEQKVTSDWGNVVFNHFYLGVKSDRSSFSNPASALNGTTISKLKKNEYKNLFDTYSKKYEELLKDFVKFAIEKKIIPASSFTPENVDAICKYLEYHSDMVKNDKPNNLNDGREKISLSPWLMRCAKNKWDAISKIVTFEMGEGPKYTVKFKSNSKKINELIDADTNYEKLEVYAGLFACCNLIYGLRHYKKDDGKSAGKNGNGFNLSDTLESLATNRNLKKYALKGRLKQWDNFKTAAAEGKIKN